MLGSGIGGGGGAGGRAIRSKHSVPAIFREGTYGWDAWTRVGVISPFFFFFYNTSSLIKEQPLKIVQMIGPRKNVSCRFSRNIGSRGKRTPSDVLGKECHIGLNEPQS